MTGTAPGMPGDAGDALAPPARAASSGEPAPPDIAARPSPPAPPSRRGLSPQLWWKSLVGLQLLAVGLVVLAVVVVWIVGMTGDVFGHR